MSEYESLPYDKLKEVHREIGALLASRRTETLEQLRSQIASLGFTADDLAPKKKKTGAQHHYRDPDNPANTYSGKGRKPQWLVDALESGRHLEEFAVT